MLAERRHPRLRECHLYHAATGQDGPGSHRGDDPAVRGIRLRQFRGILLHRYLEVVDFKTKAIPAGIFQSEKDRKTIEKVLSLPLFASLEGARIYKEYPYFDETLESNGIIDLLVVRERRIDIVDYKLKNIDDTAYKEQLETYRRNVARLFGAEKEIHTYLLSILDARVEEV